ncbi:ABC transporter ATP-binding protein [uncultured Ruminococcus sp.]|uniref:ABC transporter ATP-binding protein n=1 Tax=uncultured Ruminococcus sp. TaxID=165186 RepID=UPI0025DA09C5|nr:ABC transporter ATP-binding protein [uncultured Ruminococcus sp.]
MITIIRRILSYTKPCRKELAGMLLFALIGTGLSLYVPILIGDAVDCVVATHQVDFPALGKTAVILTATIVISALFQWLMSLCTNRLAAHTIRDLRCDLFSHLQHVPLRYIDGQARGDLIGRAVSDMEIISDGFLQAFTQFVTGIFTILGTLILMLTINIPITILVVILTPISLLVAARLTHLSRASYLKSSDARGALGGLTEEMIGSQKVVKAFTYEKRAEERFDAYNTELQRAGSKATFLGSVTNPATRFVNALIYAAVGLCGALAATGNVSFIGAITVGQLASFLTFANQYTKPFNEISGVVAELQNAAASAKRVFAVIDEPAESDDSHLPELQNCDGTMELSHVKFSYLPERPLITDFNLDVHSGQRIAIVGPTGCGKTTLINLLLRFYDVDGGEISVSGQNIAAVTRDSLRSCYGMVLQETWLFTGTVAENIAYSRPDATREEIEAAAKAAYADGFIRRLPNGYDTILTEDGSGLSQGQKQLLCIARIMLTDPPFLILDEATSSIDLRTEQRIQKAFEKLMAGKTSFIIAHRLSTIKSADWILVMNQGNILEQGTHDSLMEQAGFYAKLYQSQFADADADSE